MRQVGQFPLCFRIDRRDVEQTTKVACQIRCFDRLHHSSQFPILLRHFLNRRLAWVFKEPIRAELSCLTSKPVKLCNGGSGLL